jgi:hypothetical protein
MLLREGTMSWLVHSTRKFSPLPVPREVVNEALALAQLRIGRDPIVQHAVFLDR